jgi:hypothetical protein
MNAVSGLMSRMRCRKGEVRIGERNADRFHDLPAELGEALLECGLGFRARRPLVHQRDHPLAAVLGRPFAHDPGRLCEDEARAHEVRRGGGGDRGARDHDHGRDLGLGHERAIGERGRRNPAGDDVHLVVDDHFLNEAAGVIGDAGVVAQDQLDFLAGDLIAMLLDVEPRTGRRLPAGSGKTGAGHGKAHADLDHFLRGGAARGERDQAGGGERNRKRSASHGYSSGAVAITVLAQLTLSLAHGG